MPLLVGDWRHVDINETQGIAFPVEDVTMFWLWDKIIFECVLYRRRFSSKSSKSKRYWNENLPLHKDFN
jgi:hypothetical protein